MNMWLLPKLVNYKNPSTYPGCGVFLDTKNKFNKSLQLKYSHTFLILDKDIQQFNYFKLRLFGKALNSVLFNFKVFKGICKFLWNCINWGFLQKNYPYLEIVLRGDRP